MGIEETRSQEKLGGKGTGVALILGLVAVYVPDEGLFVDVGMAFDVRIVRELS